LPTEFSVIQRDNESLVVLGEPAVHCSCSSSH